MNIDEVEGEGGRESDKEMLKGRVKVEVKKKGWCFDVIERHDTIAHDEDRLCYASTHRSYGKVFNATNNNEDNKEKNRKKYKKKNREKKKDFLLYFIMHTCTMPIELVLETIAKVPKGYRGW